MNNILFVKMVVTDGCRNYINITKYKVQNITDERIYYYTIFDEDTTEDDVKYIEKERLENCIVKSISENAIISTIWCKEEDLQTAKEMVANELEQYLKKLINNIEICFAHSKIRSMVKI